MRSTVAVTACSTTMAYALRFTAVSEAVIVRHGLSSSLCGGVLGFNNSSLVPNIQKPAHFRIDWCFVVQS